MSTDEKRTTEKVHGSVRCAVVLFVGFIVLFLAVMTWLLLSGPFTV